jgi:hypothetical protein
VDATADYADANPPPYGLTRFPDGSGTMRKPYWRVVMTGLLLVLMACGFFLYGLDFLANGAGIAMAAVALMADANKCD